MTKRFTVNKQLSLSLALISLLFISSPIFAAALDAKDIIQRANQAAYYQGEDGSAQVRMIIVDNQGGKQLRQFTILRKDVENLKDQRFLVVFSRPTDVKGTVFRVNKHVAQQDDRWLYLPALDLVKRISAGDKRTSFVGSHFYYEDVSGRNPQEDHYQLMSVDEQSAAYIIKATPKDLDSVEYAYSINHIDKGSFLPKQVTYYDRQDNKIREMNVIKTQKVNGFDTVVHSRITQLPDGGYTDMQFRRVKYDIGLPDELFSERSMRRPPIKWLR